MILIILMFNIYHLHCVLGEQTIEKLGTTLQWYPSQLSRRHKGTPLPSRIDLSFYLQDIVQLNLIKENENIQNVPVISSFKSKFADLKQSALYRDVNKKADFSVGIRNNDVLYYGEFMYNNEYYAVMPSIGDRSENRKSDDFVYEIDLNKTTHYLRLEKLNISITTDNDAAIPPKRTDNDNLVNTVDSETRARKPPVSDGKILYTIEIFVILDNSVYRKWFDNSGRSAGNTVANLKQYYVHIVNGIKERYEGIEMPGVRYSASLTGIYIADTLEKSEFMERAKSHPQGLDPNRAVKALQDWVIKMKGKIPTFDVAALFTSYAIMPHFNGYAYIGAACTVRGVSVNRDVGSFDTIHTATHEIGHNLGAHHDSEGNHCKHEDQYIMGKGRTGTIDNLNTFSPCSLDYFQRYNHYLNSQKIMCYTNIPENIFPKDIDQYLNQHPGQNISLDKQCKIAYGKDSYFCGGDTVESLCMRMSCMGPQNTCYESPAAESTSCGDKKWCHNGRCVKDNRAPSMKGACPFGDHKSSIDYDGKMFTCQNLIKTMPFLCYQEYFNSMCCSSCDNKKKKQPKECPYGDSHSDCSISHCYTKAYFKECCGTCKSAKFGNDGKLVDICTNEKFDTRCGSVITSRQCYEGLDKLCCNACKKFKVDIPNCKYGDKGAWCEKRIKNSPEECNHLAKDCCKSCHNKT